jgi:hypothetical protein
MYGIDECLVRSTPLNDGCGHRVRARASQYRSAVSEINSIGYAGSASALRRKHRRNPQARPSALSRDVSSDGCSRSERARGIGAGIRRMERTPRLYLARHTRCAQSASARPCPRRRLWDLLLYRYSKGHDIKRRLRESVLENSQRLENRGHHRFRPSARRSAAV